MMEQSIEWQFLGSGASHVAFADSDRTLVFKVLIAGKDEPKLLYENLERSIRLWNEINQHITPSATILKNQMLPEEIRIHEKATGMLIPFINGRQATDAEISLLVLDIYNRTGRIVVDATTLGNCLTQENGRCVCVDIDLALKLDEEETQMLSMNTDHRSSFVSLESWSLLQKQFREINLDQNETRFPRTVKLLKALIFIKSVRPDIGNANFLKGTSELNLLVSAYTENMNLDGSRDTPLLTLAQDFLEQERPAHLSNLKLTCSGLLTQYLCLEESANPKVINDSKIICQQMTQYIHDAPTSDALMLYFLDHRKTLGAQEKFSGLYLALGKCLLACDAMYCANNRKSLVNSVVFFSKYAYHSSNLYRIASIHILDLLNINVKIFLPIFFLEIFIQNLSKEQIFTPLIIVLLLPVFTEVKNKLLVDLSIDVATKFTQDLLDVGFNPNTDGTERFKQSFTPEYADHVAFFIKKTYGKLLPSYIALIGFAVAIGSKDTFVGGFSAGALFLYLGYTYYFLNPRYSKAFKANLAGEQILYERLKSSIGKRDFLRYYDRVNNEKKNISRLLENVVPASKKKNYYDSQIKIVGVLTANVTFMVGVLYWVSTYQQSPQNITDYILLFYYLYMFSATMNQLTPLISQVLCSAEYAKGLIEYSMWSAKKAQNVYTQIVRATAEMQEKNKPAVIWDLYAIEFIDVTYISTNSKYNLRNFNVRVEKNNFVVVVEEKSSVDSLIVRLLRRQTSPLSGEICFDPGNLNINALEEQALYRLISIIDSKDEFIDGELSWFDSIKCGNPNISDQGVFDAACEAGLIREDEEISALKTRFIHIPDDGRKISRIENRRIAIARALVKGGLCLILDNPTQGLAYEEEIAILQTLVRLSNQLPTIMVTDKLYLLDNYLHKVLYLKEGKILEQGTYNRLMENKSFFYQAVFKQRADFQKVCSPPENIFYTVITHIPSLMARNFRPIGFIQSQTIEREEEEELKSDEDDRISLVF